MDDTEVLHAIDRALTDLLPDKHQYEADLQLYLDYSLPSHPELPYTEEERLSKHYTDADSADDLDLERGWPGSIGELKQQSFHKHDKQLAVLTEYSVEESTFFAQDARSATEFWPGTASELNDHADDSQALRDVSTAREHLHLTDEAREEGPSSEPAATPKATRRANVHESSSQADGAADVGACADSESLLTRKEGRALEDTDLEAELLQDQSPVNDNERQASLAYNAKPVAGRNRAAHMPHEAPSLKSKTYPGNHRHYCVPGQLGKTVEMCNTVC